MSYYGHWPLFWFNPHALCATNGKRPLAVIWHNVSWKSNQILSYFDKVAEWKPAFLCPFIGFADSNKHITELNMRTFAQNLVWRLWCWFWFCSPKAKKLKAGENKGKKLQKTKLFAILHLSLGLNLKWCAVSFVCSTHLVHSQLYWHMLMNTSHGFNSVKFHHHSVLPGSNLLVDPEYFFIFLFIFAGVTQCSSKKWFQLMDLNIFTCQISGICVGCLKNPPFIPVNGRYTPTESKESKEIVGACSL